MNFLTEIKRRGVFQVGVAYLVVSWLIVQVCDILLPIFGAPDWVMKALVLLLAVGFPISLALAWFYNVTAEGLRPDDDALAGSEHVAFPGQRLNHITIGVLAAAVALFALDKFVWQTELPFKGKAERHSIAVLPFRNLSGDDANEPLAHGIHDDLLTQLSRIDALRTVSRTSVMGYRDRDLPIPQIARELGVSVVLEGGVQRAGDRIRVNAQLIDGESDAHLWAETYDHILTAENIFAIQSEISRSIASTLSATLSVEEEEALEAIPTTDLEAYEAYASARASMNSVSEEELDHALDQFSLATRLDPGFAAAWAGLCMTHLGVYTQDSDRSNFDAAEAACERALELDDSRAEVHVALGTLYRYFGQYAKAEVALQSANYARAQEALERALNMDGVELDALVEMGRILAHQGRLDEAEEYLHRAEALEPQNWYVQTSLFSFYYSFSDKPDRFESAARHAARSASIRPDLAASWNNLGASNYMMGNYELAADAWEESLGIEPNRTGYTNTGLALAFSGRYEEAIVMQERAVELAPNDHRAMGRLADALRLAGGQEQRTTEAYRHASGLARDLLEVNDRDWRTLGHLATYQAYLGHETQARDMIARALQWSDRNAETLYNLAVVESVFGRDDEALSALEKLIAKDQGYINLLSVDPQFEELRQTPEYTELVSSKQR